MEEEWDDDGDDDDGGGRFPDNVGRDMVAWLPLLLMVVAAAAFDVGIALALAISSSNDNCASYMITMLKHCFKKKYMIHIPFLL